MARSSWLGALAEIPRTAFAGRKPPLIGEVAQRAGEVEFPRGDLKTTPQGIITTSKTGGLLRPYKGLTPVVAL